MAAKIEAINNKAMKNSKKEQAEKFFIELVNKNEVNNYQTITDAAKETAKIYTDFNWEYFCGFFF